MAQFHIPVLMTARLVLRGFHPSDHTALAAIYADPDVMRYIRDGVRNAAQVAANIETYAAAWALHRYGVWAVVDRQANHLHGMCGFVEEADLGYIFGRASWGRGIATEAADACIWYGFKYLEYVEIGAGALRANLASRHVLGKMGMRPQANDFFDSHGGVYYRLKHGDYHPHGATALIDLTAEP